MIRVRVRVSLTLTLIISNISLAILWSSVRVLLHQTLQIHNHSTKPDTEPALS